MKILLVKPEFVAYMPDRLEEGFLYISLEFSTVQHLCPCGCGNEIVTPLGRTDWKMICDGISVSLYPSVGSWNLPCRSHYWIWQNAIEEAGPLSKRKIELGRHADRELKRARRKAAAAP